MKNILKVLVLLLTSILILSLVGCTANTAGNNNDTATSEDERVLDAINILKQQWEKDYNEFNIEDKYLEIVNTTIINIKDHIDPEETYDYGYLFEDVDYIVEFELLSNFMETSPYYNNIGTFNCVIVYKDGTSEVSKNLLNHYKSTTYSADFSPIIESVECFHGEYDQVLDLD